jgi:rhodanese-related sulfurtransferase
MDPHFDGVIWKTHTAELRRRIARPFPPFCVIDVRWRGDFEREHIPGAVNILPENLKSLPPGTTERTEFIVVGEHPEDPVMRQASLALRHLGTYRVVELTDGMTEWKRAGGPVEGGAGTKAA